MSYILLGVIQLYWHLIPEHKRRNCLFRESCSHYVYRIAKEKGFFSACSALIDRIKKCRPGYELSKDGDKFQLRLKDGTLVPEEDIALSILRSFS
jgi:putative component of membrane protein insertase Oxa1/YidC/SpoIIIJ protein YidD